MAWTYLAWGYTIKQIWQTCILQTQSCLQTQSDSDYFPASRSVEQKYKPLTLVLEIPRNLVLGRYVIVFRMSVRFLLATVATVVFSISGFGQSDSLAADISKHFSSFEVIRIDKETASAATGSSRSLSFQFADKNIELLIIHVRNSVP